MFLLLDAAHKVLKKWSDQKYYDCINLTLMVSQIVAVQPAENTKKNTMFKKAFKKLEKNSRLNTARQQSQAPRPTNTYIDNLCIFA